MSVCVALIAIIVHCDHTVVAFDVNSNDKINIMKTFFMPVVQIFVEITNY